MVAEQHFTQPPSRYTEASLIKEMEERGIGRPSTYAPTIDVIQERAYVRQEERRLQPTELGKTVDGLLREHFPEIVDVDFTADLERRLDGIEGGTRKYEPTVRDWYTPFDATVVKAEATMQRVKVPAKPTGEKCPECGVGELVLRQGRFGEFVGCSRYPECSYIKDKKVSTAVVTGEVCPQCGKPLVQREGRRGPFVGCSGYPKCRYIRDLPAAAAAASTDPGAVPARPRPRRSAPVRSAASRWPARTAVAAASWAAPDIPGASTSSPGAEVQRPPRPRSPPGKRAPTAANRWSAARVASDRSSAAAAIRAASTGHPRRRPPRHGRARREPAAPRHHHPRSAPRRHRGHRR